MLDHIEIYSETAKSVIHEQKIEPASQKNFLTLNYTEKKIEISYPSGGENYSSYRSTDERCFCKE